MQRSCRHFLTTAHSGRLTIYLTIRPFALKGYGQMQAEEVFIWGTNERKTGEFRYSMTITNSHLVAQPIKMQDLY